MTCRMSDERRKNWHKNQKSPVNGSMMKQLDNHIDISRRPKQAQTASGHFGRFCCTSIQIKIVKTITEMRLRNNASTLSCLHWQDEFKQRTDGVMGLHAHRQADRLPPKC